MVLTQLVSPSQKTTPYTCFHTTMVLTQPDRGHIQADERVHKFPYHYGSHATVS